MNPSRAAPSRERLQVRVLGVVQGVGFRPFVHHLATELGLDGWILNDSDGVTLEVEGPHDALLRFLERLGREPPRAAILHAIDSRFLPAVGLCGFEIRPSQAVEGPPRTWILPDLVVCDDCVRELLDPTDRRYRYPFLNCTNCGPRFTILEGLPYDRPQTAMRAFEMCPRCREEYEDPKDRRFHAQPTACEECGPRLRAWVPKGSRLEDGPPRERPVFGEAALRAAQVWIDGGQIVAMKGLGGYHLIVDAANEDALQRLRARKRRPYKPLALMYPSLERLRAHVEVPAFVEPLLGSAQGPIVLLPRTVAGWKEVAPSVAPRAPQLGVFLPTTPLHRLLLEDLDRPLVVTSGNASDQPTLHDDAEAERELHALVDAFLDHDRPIVRQVDDSVLQVIQRPETRPQLLRRARGYAPLPVLAPRSLPAALAVGGQMNVVFALARDREVILSQHLGEMETHEARESYRRILDDFLRLYAVQPEWIAHDLHPDYWTTALASELAVQWQVPTHAVQHHQAHMAAAMLEHELEGEVLALTWDGTGYGPDGTVWGGEFLRGDAARSRRVATLVEFGLPGGEAAVHETWRTGLALADAAFAGSVDGAKIIPADVVEEPRRRMVEQLLAQGTAMVPTTSIGRLFDGVAALLGLSFENAHQAQSPQLLEAAAWSHGSEAPALPLPVVEDELRRLDWRVTVRALVEARRAGRSPEELAAGFHHALVEAAVEVVRSEGVGDVVLTGGVFCNRYLTEALLERLVGMGVRARAHSQIPPTDGGIAAGQIWAAENRR